MFSAGVHYFWMLCFGFCPVSSGLKTVKVESIQLCCTLQGSVLAKAQLCAGSQVYTFFSQEALILLHPDNAYLHRHEQKIAFDVFSAHNSQTTKWQNMSCGTVVSRLMRPVWLEYKQYASVENILVSSGRRSSAPPKTSNFDKR